LTWYAVIGQSPAITAVTSPLLPAPKFSSLQATLGLYTEYLNAANACYGSVKSLLATTKPLSKTVSAALTSFSQGLKTLLSSQNGPDLIDNSLSRNTNAANTAAAEYLKNLKAGHTVDEQALEAALDAATVPWSGTPDSALRKALNQASSSILPLYQKTYDTISGQCQVMRGEFYIVFLWYSLDTDYKSGTGGVGGASFGPNPRSGTRGQFGKLGTLSFKELVFDGRPDDLDVLMAFAFPDQCQMLLNKANNLFFQNTPQSKHDASVFYGRLIKRLSFWPALSAAQSSDNPPTPESALAKSYDRLEYVLQVTKSASDQLQSIYSQAKSFNNQIITGNDMFGHNALWVPRLNYDYYAGEIKDFLDTLKSVEDAYKNALNVKASLTDIASGQNAAASGVQRAQDRISLLTSDNGPLTSSADTIARYTPLLKSKVQEVKAKMEKVQSDIQAKLNLDPLDILSGLSMVAMAPSVPLGLVSGPQPAFLLFLFLLLSLSLYHSNVY
jgi:hypothetical protein